MLQVKDMCLRFAAMEALHGETERARAIYVHASTYCDPRTAKAFWKTWQDFEVEHGNEESFREMLRIKRSVATSFSSANYAVEELLQQASGTTAVAAAPALMDAAAAGEDAPAAANPAAASLAGSKRTAAQALLPSMRAVPVAGGPSSAAGALAGGSSAANPDEIDLDDEDAAPVGEMIPDVDVQQRTVPAAVFGGISADAEAGVRSGAAPAATGALDRFRSRPGK
jgi:pre-mRNA-splicing factor SYF1